MLVKKKPDKPGFAALIKQFTNVDPYRCILCSDRLHFSGALAGKGATELLSDRLHQWVKKTLVAGTDSGASRLKRRF